MVPVFAQPDQQFFCGDCAPGTGCPSSQGVRPINRSTGWIGGPVRRADITMQARWHRVTCIDMIEANAKAQGDGRMLSGNLDEIAHAHRTIAMRAAQGAIVVWLQGAHLM